MTVTHEPLTPRQRQILQVIQTSVREHGYPPTVKEIGRAVGLASTSSVASQLVNLEAAGYIRRDPDRLRAITLVDAVVVADAPTPDRRLAVVPPAPDLPVGDAAEVLDVEYLSPDWHQVRRTGIAASEIAAVLGISPYMSPFDLWWLKKTGEQSEGENKDMRRGRRYEALILQDFADEHPEFILGPSITVINIDRPWQIATPDGLAYETAYGPGDQVPVAVIEAKDSAERWAWGEPGTDDIPVHYRAQVIWQMDILGLEEAILPVRFGSDGYAEYHVSYDPVDAETMRTAAAEFLASIDADAQPDIDAHRATTRRLKKNHPTVDDDLQVEIPATIVRQYQRARALKKAAEERMDLASNRVRALLGDAGVGLITTDSGTRKFTRSVTDMPERTQLIRAHQRHSINWPRKEI